MNSYRHQIRIRKEYLKFSAAHLTVFPDGTFERLHGHNYTTEVTLGLKAIEFERLVPFSEIKKAIEELCEAWDERVLIPTQNPYLKLGEQNGAQIEFWLGVKHYVLPKEDVVLLALDNITSETLAAECCRRLISALQNKPGYDLIESVEFRVEESPGQGACCIWKPQS